MDLLSVKCMITEVLYQLKNCSTILSSAQIHLTEGISNTAVKGIIKKPTTSAKFHTKRDNQSMSNTAEKIKG